MKGLKNVLNLSLSSPSAKNEKLSVLQIMLRLEQDAMFRNKTMCGDLYG